MSAFFRGMTEIVPSLFRGIFSERNSVPNPTYSQLTPLRGVAVQARTPVNIGCMEPCPSYVAWQAGIMATPLSWLS
jgi:hypothetical protein